jgi:hypothetical protein
MKLFWIVTFILAACGGGSLDVPSTGIVDDYSINEVPVTEQPAAFVSETDVSAPSTLEKKIRKSGIFLSNPRIWTRTTHKSKTSCHGTRRISKMKTNPMTSIAETTN